MYNRQKALLYLLLQFKLRGKEISKTRLNKLLFVMKKESVIGERIKFYSFYPHKYGPFSSQLELDIADLQSRGMLSDELLSLINEAEIHEMVSEKDRSIIGSCIDRFVGIDVVSYVYSKYPEYTSRSLRVKHEKTAKTPGIFSIGYEGHDIDSFLDVLIRNGVETVVDVRFNPFSMNPVFIKQRLQAHLNRVGIGYIHMPELGIDGRYRKDLADDKDYQRLFKFYSESILPKHMDMVCELGELGSRKRIALLGFV